MNDKRFRVYLVEWHAIAGPFARRAEEQFDSLEAAVNSNINFYPHVGQRVIIDFGQMRIDGTFGDRGHIVQIIDPERGF